MTLQQLTNFLQDLCHQGNAQKEINKDDIEYLFETFETIEKGVKNT